MRMTVKEKSFEQSLEKLREMADKIKSPDTNLEESIKCYEEGMKYYEKCSAILTDAKQKIETFEIDN
jgi:exodeoxyribonuclease VII small subunit